MVTSSSWLGFRFPSWRAILAVVALPPVLLLIADRSRSKPIVSNQDRVVVPNNNPKFCWEVSQQIKHLTHPWEFNQLRRTVMALEDSSCYDDLFPQFAKAFQSRIGRQRQYSLHIPKTGGTSLCQFALRNNYTSPHDNFSNCHMKELSPFWCCVEDLQQLRPLTCKEINNRPFDFIGNERWLDHDEDLFCDDMVHSITIREPVSRAMSQTNMFLAYFVIQDQKVETRTKRLNIIQSNYMTWSLVSGTSKDPTMFLVQEKHLPLAKTMLNRFDYIIDIPGVTSTSDSECLGLMLEYMGMADEQEIPSAQKAWVANYTSFYHVEDYTRYNAIDIQLYEYARELIEMDCKFFRQINEEYRGPASPDRMNRYRDLVT